MNSHHGYVPYWWSTCLGLFSMLSLQDYVFILGALISAIFTVKTYFDRRKDDRARMEEERKRTRILEEALLSRNTKIENLSETETEALIFEIKGGRR